MPFAQLPVVNGRFVERHVGWIVALRHGHTMGEIFRWLVCRPRLERRPICFGQFGDEQGQIVFFQLRDVFFLLQALSDRFHRFLFRCLDFFFARGLGLFQGCARLVELGEVEPHVRVAIDRHKHWTATDHETFSFTR